jgi:hypothetical protein
MKTKHLCRLALAALALVNSVSVKANMFVNSYYPEYEQYIIITHHHAEWQEGTSSTQDYYIEASDTCFAGWVESSEAYPDDNEQMEDPPNHQQPAAECGDWYDLTDMVDLRPHFGGGNPTGPTEVSPSWGGTSFTYNGGWQVPSCSAGSAGVTVSGAQINAGTYTATVSLNDTTNYKWAAGAQTSVSFTINKADQPAIGSTSATVAWNGSYAPGYTGGAGSGGWTFCVASISNFGTGAINAGNCSWQVGSWQIWVTHAGDGNYNAAGPTGGGTLTIQPPPVQNVTLSWNNITVTYDGAAHAAGWTSNFPGVVATSGGGQSNAGTYSMSASLTDTTHYQWDPSASPNGGSYTILRAGQGAPNVSFPYTPSPGGSVTATASGGGGHGLLTWTSGPTFIGVGVGTLTASAHWNGDGNYNPSSDGSASVTVVNQNQGAPSVSFPFTPNPGGSVTATASGSGPGGLVWTSGPTFTNVGAGTTLTASAYYAATTGYNQSPTASAQITIPNYIWINFSANNASTTYGQAAPGFGYSATDSHYAGSPSLSTTYTVGSAAGSYPISIGSGSLSASSPYAIGGLNGATLTVNKASQSITFGPLANHTYGDGTTSITLSASASSGLPVSYSLVGTTTPGAASIVGNTLNILGAGFIAVAADQSGNGNYNAASSVQQSFSVAKAAGAVISLSPTNLTLAIGATPTFTVTGSLYGVSWGGSASSYFAATSAPTVVPTFSVAGSFTLTAQDPGDANHDPSNVASATVVVLNTPLITSAGATGTYGQSFTYQITASNAPTSYSATGLPPGLNLNAATGVISGIPTSAQSGVAYPVVLSASNAGGSGPTTTVNFTINRAAQTVALTNPGPHAYGDLPFAVTASASSGLGVTLSVISGPATGSGANLTITGAGTITIQAAQAGNANWIPASAQQTFTADRAAVPIDNFGNQNFSAGPNNVLASYLAGSMVSLPPVGPTGPITYAITAATNPEGVAYNPIGAVSAGTSLYAGQFTIVASYAGDSNYYPVTATATWNVGAGPGILFVGGTTIAFPDASTYAVLDAPYNFPLVTPAQLLLRNDGWGPITLTGLSNAGTYAADFMYVGTDAGTWPVTLQPGQSTYVHWLFKPTLIGAETTTATLTSTAANAPSTTLTLSGTGYNPRLQVHWGPLQYH